MSSYAKCPNCESFETRSVYTTDANHSATEIERVMLCDSCECQYVARFVLSEREVDDNPTDANAERFSK